jgi:hypothetical protein
MRVEYCSNCKCYSCRRIRAARTTRALNRRAAIARMLNSYKETPNEDAGHAGGKT